MSLEGRCWVSVCEKMPETEQRVLVKAAGKTIFGQPAVSTAVYEDNYPQQFEIHDERFEFEVTHWMPLQAEPREPASA